MYFIPRTLDVDELIRTQKSCIEGFKKESILYILSLITTIPLYNEKCITADGYVSINAKLLQQKIRNYRKYLDYLIDAGIIETDNRYISGAKSKGYRFTKAYSGLVVKYVELDTTKQIKQCSKIKLTSTQRKEYGHLTKWFDDQLSIQKEYALDYIMRHYNNSKTICISTRMPVDSIIAIRKYNSALAHIEKFAARDFYLTIDDIGYRLHSPLVNLKSELRNCLLYNGLELLSVDIKNCQPFLCTLLFNCSFWDGDNTLPLTLNTIGLQYKDIFKSDSHYSSFIMLCKNAERLVDSDVQRFKEKVHDGTFYEYIASEIGMTDITRAELKSVVFQVLFTDNRYLAAKSAAPKREFKRMFPTVYEILCSIKRKDKAILPKILQRVESHFILKTVTKRISIERPDLPIFTIHDSIVTIHGEEEYVKKLLNEEAKKVFSFSPQLSLTEWHVGKLGEEKQSAVGVRA